MKEYRASWKKNLKALSPSLKLIALVCLSNLFPLIVSTSNTPFLILWPLLVLILPVIIIHCRYLVFDHGKIIQLTNNGQAISIKRHTIEEAKFGLEEIERIELVCRTFKDGMTWLPWAKYFYVVFRLRNKNKIAVTNLSLSLNELEEFNLPIHKKHNPFPITLNI